MSTARDVMHMGADCIDQNETLAAAAEMMRDLHVGALPICGSDNRLHGIITDRDIVVNVIAEGLDPQIMTAGEMAQGTPIWVDVDDDADEVLRVMTESAIRRVPVMEEHQVVGMISEADLAVSLDQAQVKQFAESIYSAPPNS
jgi:CBS domain-containing protein